PSCSRASPRCPRPPWVERSPDPEAEAPITTLVQLHATSPAKAVSTLAPFLGRGTLAVPHAPTSSVIVSGPERRVARVLGLLRALDEAAREELVVRRLRYSSADKMAEILRTVYGEPVGDRPRLEIWPDARSNTLIVRAAPERMGEIRAHIDRLDRPPSGGGALRVIRLMNHDAEALAQILNSLATAPVASPSAGRGGAAHGLSGRSYTVVADVPTRSLVVRASPETHEAIRRVVEGLDVPLPRVSVDVVIFEVSLEEGLEVGFDALLRGGTSAGGGTVAGQIFSNPSGGDLRAPGEDTAETLIGRVTREPLLIPIVNQDATPVDVVITADEREVTSRVVMRPHLRMISGEEQRISVGNNIPVPVASSSGAGNPFQTRQDIQRQDVGITLRIRPTLGQAGAVELELDVDITRVVDSIAGPVEEVGPTIQQRRLEATVSLEAGEVAMLGMLDAPQTVEVVDGTPWLKDLPGIGFLFRNKREMTRKRRLVIAVQAEILRSFEEDMAETIRRRIAFERAQTRLGGLGVDPNVPYALLVSTRTVESDAEAIAESLALQGRESQVVAWDYDGESRYDVYLTGFSGLPSAASLAMQLRDEGWTPELVVVPSEDL
ncbi:MAG: hypothetical protein O7A09_13265, partial [Proteobacteria bacterium]|nr:hypothetical protein [Pseudomonadota bacterium]